MTLPNKISMPVSGGTWENYAAVDDKLRTITKWCNDNVSRNGVLWDYKIEHDSIDFYFASAQDATVFRLTNSI